MRIRHTQSQASDGYATVAIFAIVALAVSLIVLNSRTLTHLKREIQLIDKRQTELLAINSPLTHTNQPPKTVNTP